MGGKEELNHDSDSSWTGVETFLHMDAEQLESEEQEAQKRGEIRRRFIHDELWDSHYSESVAIMCQLEQNAM